MKIIGLLIAAVILAIMVFWWLDLTFKNVEQATTAPPQVENYQFDPGQTGIGALEHSKQQVDIINEKNQDYNEVINQLQ